MKPAHAQQKRDRVDGGDELSLPIDERIHDIRKRIAEKRLLPRLARLSCPLI